MNELSRRNWSKPAFYFSTLAKVHDIQRNCDPNSIFQIGTENTPCDISNALSFITDQKSHIKTKNGAHLCPKGSTISFQNPSSIFFYSKYDISKYVGPIFMIFSANWWKFNSIYSLIKNEIVRKISKFWNKFEILELWQVSVF